MPWRAFVCELTLSCCDDWAPGSFNSKDSSNDAYFHPQKTSCWWGFTWMHQFLPVEGLFFPVHFLYILWYDYKCGWPSISLVPQQDQDVISGSFWLPLSSSNPPPKQPLMFWFCFLYVLLYSFERSSLVAANYAAFVNVEILMSRITTTLKIQMQLWMLLLPSSKRLSN